MSLFEGPRNYDNDKYPLQDFERSWKYVEIQGFVIYVKQNVCLLIFLSFFFFPKKMSL